MNATSLLQPEMVKQPKRVGQWKLLLIFAVALLPLIAAVIMYFGKIGLPSGTTNHGLLVLPPLTEDDHGIKVGGSDYPGAIQPDGRRKWLLLILGPTGASPGNSLCDKACEQTLYLARQVNVALGKDADRVGRLLLSSEPVSLPVPDVALMQQAFSAAAFSRLSDEMVNVRQGLNPWEILIMDPFGNIMMHYPGELDGKGILEDLRRLLKVSKIG